MEAYEIASILAFPLGITAIVVGSALYSGWEIKKFETWQLILASLHLTLAITMYVLTGLSSDPWTVPVRMSYNRWEVHELGECSDRRPCYIYTEHDDLGDFKTTFLVPIYSLISGLHHLIAAYSLRMGQSFYVNQIAGGINLVRWIDYALSSSLMLVILEILFLSPPDVRLLLFTAFIQVFVIMAGYASDIARTTKMWAHAFGIFGLACVIYSGFFSMQWYLFSRGIRSSDAPSVVYIFVGYVSFTFSLFAIVQGYFTYKEYASSGKSTPETTLDLRTKQEVYFSFLSFFSKVPLLMTFYFGLTTRSSAGIQVNTDMCNITETTTTSPYLGDDNGTTQFETYLPFIITTIFCTIVGSIMLYINPKLETKPGNKYVALY